MEQSTGNMGRDGRWRSRRNEIQRLGKVLKYQEEGLEDTVATEGFHIIRWEWQG